MVEGFLFCRDRDRLFTLDFMGLSFVVSLLISSAFPCRPARDRGRAVCGCRFVVVVRPPWFETPCFGTGRRLTLGNFFLVEAPHWPLVCKFFAVVMYRMSPVICCIFVPKSGISYPVYHILFDEILQLLETCTAFGIKFHGYIFCGFSHYYFC